MLRIELLGDFRLISDGQPVNSLDSPRLQSLLAYLLLHRNAPQSRQHLAFLLWPDSSESRARNNLRQALFLLRHAVPDAAHCLSVDTQTTQWLPDSAFALDVVDFEQAIKPNASPDSLEEAIELYRSELLMGCYDDWIHPERERLREGFCDALERVIAACEKQGDFRRKLRQSQDGDVSQSRPIQ